MTRNKRSLNSVLLSGEIVQYKYRGEIYEAYFQDGILIRADDGTTFDTPTAFTNAISGGSVSGWQHCRVLRDGISRRLADLPERVFSLEETKDVPTITLKEMPPKSIKVKRLVPATVVAHIIEAAEPALEVRAVKRILLKPIDIDKTTFWRDGEKEKIFEKTANGGVGSYVGRWTGSSIDSSVPDSDAEST
jgi:hypothetical protein